MGNNVVGTIPVTVFHAESVHCSTVWLAG